MSVFTDLKLYRKFLIIGVLLTSAFVVSSTNRASASCCDICEDNLSACNTICYGLSSDPATEDCLADCAEAYDTCSHRCGHGIPICPPI